MCIDDRSADGQADAQTIGFGGEKSLEQTLRFAGRQTNAGIRHSDHYSPRGIRSRAQPENPRSTIQCRHSLNPVHHEVHDDLLQLYSVTNNRTQVDGKVDLEHHALPTNLARQQCHRLPDRVVDVERRAGRRRFLCHLADTLNHTAGAMSIFSGSSRRSGRAADIGRVVRKPGYAFASSRGDGRQRLAYFMCNQAGQFADRGESRGPRKVRLHRLQCLLRTFVVAYVDRRTDIALEPPETVYGGSADNMQMPQSVRTDQATLAGESGTVADRRLHRAAKGSAVLGMDHAKGARNGRGFLAVGLQAENPTVLVRPKQLAAGVVTAPKPG